MNNKAPLKMKLHNFDPFNLGYNEIGPSGVVVGPRGGSPIN